MEGKAHEPVRNSMKSLSLAFDDEILSQRLKIDSLAESLEQALTSLQATARETVHCQGDLWKAKARLREADDDWLKAISVRNRKEAKRISIMDSLVATRSRVEELQRILNDQRAERDDYDEILSQKYTVPEAEETGYQNGNDDLQEAISWYNRVLGFRVESGHGVKFIYKKIGVKNPDEEFSFTIRHENDAYSLLDCIPELDGLNELICELNRTNGLFKFVRIMRQKFQVAALQGLLRQSTSIPPESLLVSASAPATSVS